MVTEVERNAAAMETWLKSQYFTFEYFDELVLITVEDFMQLIATAATDQDNRRLTDNQIALPILLLTHVIKERSDVVVIPPGAASTLCDIGLGEKNSESFLETHRVLCSAMKDEAFRWIVVPCTDGMLSSDLRDKDAAKQNESKDTNSNNDDGSRPTLPTYVGGAKHWGLMVIDKIRNDACWLDGHLRLGPKRSNSKQLRIEYMSLAGRAAGKVLCGYDQVMSNEPGGFTARTLKYIPQDHEDNAYRGDEGSACGPYAFGMLQYIFNNPAFLENLKETFLRSKWDRHCTNLKFNSWSTRLQMQDLIRREAHKHESMDEMPYKTTARVLKLLERSQIMNLFGALNNALEGAIFRGPLPSQRYKNNGKGSSNQENTGHSGSEETGHNSSTGTGPNVYKKIPIETLRPYLSDGPPETMTERLEAAYQALVHDQKKRLGGTSSTDPPKPEVSGIHSKRWKEALKFPEGFSRDNLPNFLKLSNTDTEDWASLYRDDLFRYPMEDLNITFYSEKAVLHRTYRGSFTNERLETLLSIQSYDTHAFTSDEQRAVWNYEDIVARLNETYFQLEVPLFAALADAEVVNWVKYLHHKARAAMPAASDENFHNRARGILYRIFVGDIEDMSPEDLTEWRKADPYLHRSNKVDNETALVAMNILYKVEKPNELPYLRESPLHWPAREHRPRRGRKRGRDDDNNADNDESNSGGKRKRLKDETQKEDTTAPRETEPTVEIPHFMEHNNPTEAAKLTDWATMSDVDLKKYLTADVRQDPRVGPNANKYTYRALLFIRHGGTFKSDSQLNNSHLWVRDTNVFKHELESDGKDTDLVLNEGGMLEVRTPSKTIIRRMAARYEVSNSTDLDLAALENATVNFTKMHEAKINEWVALKPDNIPLTFDDELWFKKAVLQKLFGGFDHLSPSDLQYLQDNDRHFETEIKDKTWTLERIVPMQKARVSTIPAHDLRGKLLYYPQSHIEWFRNVEQKRLAAENLDDFDELTFSDEEEPTSSDGVDATNKGGKRKRDTNDTGDRSPGKKQKLSDPDFLNMSDSELEAWLQMLPAAIKPHLRNSIANTWRIDTKAKVWLARSFTRTFQNMQAEEELSTESQAVLRKWRLAHPDSVRAHYHPANNPRVLKNFLNKRIMSNVVGETKASEGPKTGNGKSKPPSLITIELPDYSNDRTKWPTYWTKHVAEERKAAKAEATNSKASSITDYATLPIDELSKHITDRVKKHKSILPKGKANEYTYRAILFVTHGGTYKDESEERCKTVWIRDTNVFTEGVDFEVGQDGVPKLKLGLDETQIRNRMQVRYEVDETIVQIVLDSESDSE